ncbi:RteC domain-containing protein [Myroides marinus]|uniref:RteC domain-containing protein n=1 Tax=Myroides marinus TaxID=703342 RepID=UPI0025753453|nr:RteC domain-containing protein [Myroides marinus]MDM1368250.1 RteC domain-containing protein [Myroides marinus]
MTKLNGKTTQDLIFKEESKLTLDPSLIIKEAKYMTTYLSRVLAKQKELIITHGFSNQEEEIYFFKILKPKILSKLMYYNKIYKIETHSPNTTCKTLKEYYLKKLKQVSSEYKLYYINSEIYKYYKSQRTDKDKEYYTRGNIDILKGVNSIAFEIDHQFSTYYDYKLSRILSSELLYEYLSIRLNQLTITTFSKDITTTTPLLWSESSTALVELIYALYASGAINQGDLEIRKIAYLFQNYFNITLSDVHHTFHRMKTRNYSRTIFLDKLKKSLEDYMDKDQEF